MIVYMVVLLSVSVLVLIGILIALVIANVERDEQSRKIGDKLEEIRWQNVAGRYRYVEFDSINRSLARVSDTLSDVDESVRDTLSILQSVFSPPEPTQQEKLKEMVSKADLLNLRITLDSQPKSK